MMADNRISGESMEDTVETRLPVSDEEPGRNPLGEYQRELLSLQPIATQMPVIFENGASWSKFTGHCASCGQPINPYLLRGRVTRPMNNVAVIEAIGVCPPCRLATTYLYRLHDDMRLTGRDRSGRWHEWRQNPSLWNKIKRFLWS